MTTRTGQGFPKTARIRRRGEFLSFGRKSERARMEHFVVLARPAAGPARLGMTVSRKIGAATVRNRLKRHIREVFRRHPDRSGLRSDLVIIAKDGAGTLAFDDVLRQFRSVIGSLPTRPRA